MEPFFFGPRRRLYGAYHPPELRTPAPETAVVVCQSIGHEYMRAHRCCWQLAQAATRRNAHVLRFDYAATGDSFGRQHDASWQAWIDNVHTAADWLRERSGLSDIRLLGLRVGALIATQAAANARDLLRVTLCEPVLDGRQFMTDLMSMHIAFTRERNRYRRARRRYAEADTDEFLGFHLPPDVVEPLGETRMDRLIAHSAIRFDLADSQAGDTRRDLTRRIEAHGGRAIELAENPAWHDLNTQHRRLTLARSMPALVQLITDA